MSGDEATMKVALLFGGEGSERAISLKTGRAFRDALERLEIPHVAIDLYPSAIPELLAAKADVALIAMHGRAGEGGPLQGLLEFAGIPYTGSGLFASAVSMDKIASKKLLDAAGVATPEWWAPSEGTMVKPGSDAFPLVVKPADEGSSVGVSRVSTRQDLEAAIGALENAGSVALIERCIDGAELSVGLMDGEVLGVVEIEVAEGFYDYSAKYERGDTRYHIPPRIPADRLARVEQTAREAWKTLRCRGVGRIDIMLDADGKPWVLEANTVPGMTPTSIVPKLARARGYSFDEFVLAMLRSARLDTGGAR